MDRGDQCEWRNYEDAFRPVRERLGTRPLQSITKADIEDLMDWMLTAGRRPGTGLSGRTARLTLGRLTAALEMAVLEGKLVRNVARLVKPPEHTPRERETWSKAEVKKFLAKAASDRLHAAWRLSLYGLRRGEVPGKHHSTSPEYCRLPVSTRASRSRSSASGPVTMTRLSPSGPTSTRAMTT